MDPRWTHLRQVSPLALDDETWPVIEVAYQTPPRAYHDATHLIELGEHYQWVARSIGWTHGREVFAAMLFHDAIYIAGAADNERLSARLARDVLKATSLDLDLVETMILATANHGKSPVVESSGEDDLSRFLDSDLAILGASPERFAEYERQIAQEFAAIPSDLFRIGRRAFLSRCLAMPRLYASELFFERFEARARENLRLAVARDEVD